MQIQETLDDLRQSLVGHFADRFAEPGLLDADQFVGDPFGELAGPFAVEGDLFGVVDLDPADALVDARMMQRIDQLVDLLFA